MMSLFQGLISTSIHMKSRIFRMADIAGFMCTVQEMLGNLAWAIKRKR